MSRVWILTLFAGIAVVLGDVAMALLGPFASLQSPVEAIFRAAVGAAWIAAGLVAWARRVPRCGWEG